MSFSTFKTLKIATRKSALALWQAYYVRQLLLENPIFTDYNPELLPMVSTGDLKLDTMLAKVGGKGLFTQELEQALKQKEAQIAVHSLKDVPIEAAARYAYTYLGRQAYEDVAIFTKVSGYQCLADLPEGAVVGTASVRRKALLAATYPHLQTKLLRGNVNTRLAKLEDPAQGYDAIILALPGVQRLNLLDSEKYAYQVLKVTDGWICAPGQGTLAIQWDLEQELAPLRYFVNNVVDDFITQIERGIATKLGGSCSLPLGVHAQLQDKTTGAALANATLYQQLQEFIFKQSQELFTTAGLVAYPQNALSTLQQQFAPESEELVTVYKQLKTQLYPQGLPQIKAQALTTAVQTKLQQLSKEQAVPQHLQANNYQLQVAVFLGDLEAKKVINKTYNFVLKEIDFLALTSATSQAEIKSIVEQVSADLIKEGFAQVKANLDEQLAQQA